MKIVATILVLVLTPAAALAMCGSHDSAAQCSNGQVWDAASQSCVSRATS